MNRNEPGRNAADALDSELEMMEVEEILDELSGREMQDLLQTLALEDARIRRRIISRFSTPDGGYVQSDLIREINSIWSRYEYRGFIDYRHSIAFERELCDALVDAVRPLMRDETLTEAFETTYSFLLHLESIQIDDSNGFFTSTMDLCSRIWEQIAMLAQRSDRAAYVLRHMCNTLCLFVSENPARDVAEIYWHLSNSTTTYLVESFPYDDELARMILELIDRKLAEEPSSKGSWSGYSDFARSTWAARRLTVMKRLGRALRERLDFAQPYLHHHAIRLSFVDEMKERGDFDDAIALLLEGRNGYDETYRSTAFAAELAELYELSGDIDLACGEMRTLVVNENGVGGKDTRWFEKLKNLTPPESWAALRDELLSSAKDGRCRRSCLALEGLYDRLMSDIEETGGEMWGGKLAEIRRFRKELGPLYPERLLPAYRASIEKTLSGYGCNRATYQSVVSLMFEMDEIDGGTASEELATFIREKYKRRSALMDELTKAGW